MTAPNKIPTLREQILRRIVPLTAIVFALTSFLAFYSLVSEFRREVQVRVEVNALNFAKAADTRMRESANAVAAIAKNDVVINGIIDIESRQASAKPLFRSLVLPGPKEQFVVMTNYRGNPIAQNHNEHLSQPEVDDLLFQWNGLKPIWAQTVLKDGKSFVGSKSNWLLFASPILYSNQSEGAVVCIYRLDSFCQELLESTESTIQGFEQNGKVFVSGDEKYLPIHAGVSSFPQWFSSRVAISSLPDVNAIVMESEHTVTKASRTVILALSAFMAVWLLGIVLAIFRATYMVAAPIESLINRIKDVQATGDLTLRVDEAGPLEIRKLSSSFNMMLAELDMTTVSKESYKKLALVAKYTDNGVVITDSKGRIDWINDGFTRITGYTFDEVIGKSPGSLLQGELSDPETVQLMRDAIAQKRGFDVEIINYSKAGIPYWVAIETRPILEDGEVKFIAIEGDISERKKNEKDKENLSRELQDAARQAGMAEIATGVLHNVGNVLNSINVSTNCLVRSRRESPLKSFAKANALIQENRDDLANFFTKNKRGTLLPDFFDSLLKSLENEQEREIEELNELADHVAHVNEIVAFQQSYAKRGGVTESVDLAGAIDGVLKMNANSFKGIQISVAKDYQDQIVLALNKHKFLQIIINLVTNAKHAICDTDGDQRLLNVSIRKVNGFAEISVTDSGIGISATNLAKIFGHGFTTKKNGHGFGLHSSALAAQEMGGSLEVSSPGEGCGATFTLKIPLEKAHELKETTAASADLDSPMRGGMLASAE